MSSLAGLRVAVTRADAPEDELSRALAARDATVVPLPMLAFGPPADPARLVAALRALDGYDAVAVTSREGLRRLAAAGHRPRTLVVSGTGSADEAAALGLPVALVPGEHRAEGIVAAAEQRWGEGLSGIRWLLLRAAGSRPHLPEALAARGCAVDDVELYAVGPPADPGPLRRALEAGLDLLAITAGRSARHAVQAAGEDHVGLLKAVPVATIGPVASAACRELGLTVVAEASPARMDALVSAIEAWRCP